MKNEKNVFGKGGIFPALLTPFDEYGEINERETRKIVNWLIKTGVSGISPLGSVGEFIHLDKESKVHMMKVVVDEVKGRIPVIAGTTESCSSRCLELTALARDMGCAYVLIAPPFYYPTTEGALEAHYKEVALAFPETPIIVYNVPLFGTAISKELMIRLSRLNNIIGVKDSSGSMIDLLHLKDLLGEEEGHRFNFIMGREELFYSSLAVGVKSTISATSSIIPEFMIEIFKAYFAGELDRALQIQKSIIALVRIMFTLPFPLGFKIALECRGFNLGPPLKKLSVAEESDCTRVKDEIRTLMAGLLGDRLVVDSSSIK